jgi:hypothetical protein
MRSSERSQASRTIALIFGYATESPAMQAVVKIIRQI